jgi:hypothetical protein
MAYAATERGALRVPAVEGDRPNQVEVRVPGASEIGIGEVTPHAK